MIASYLTLEQILLIHDQGIEQFGGSHGIRDLALLESAVMRPQSTFGGKDLYKSFFDKAAALMHSIILNHPFVDGNKRTGSVSAIVFLTLNRYEVNVTNDNLVLTAIEAANKEIDIEQISIWLKKHSEKI